MSIFPSRCSCNELTLSRRSFVTLAALGGGAALLARAMPAFAGGKAKALLLTCIDFRLLEHVDEYMKGRGLEHQYDHAILAGASLGVLLDKKPEWASTFWDHVAIAKQLHQIETVMVIDHRDCGAYRVFVGPESVKDADTETATHRGMLGRFAGQLKSRHPDLSVETLLMALDGTVETIAV